MQFLFSCSLLRGGLSMSADSVFSSEPSGGTTATEDALSRPHRPVTSSPSAPEALETSSTTHARSLDAIPRRTSFTVSSIQASFSLVCGFCILIDLPCTPPGASFVREGLRTVANAQRPVLGRGNNGWPNGVMYVVVIDCREDPLPVGWTPKPWTRNSPIT